MDHPLLLLAILAAAGLVVGFVIRFNVRRAEASKRKSERIYIDTLPKAPKHRPPGDTLGGGAAH